MLRYILDSLMIRFWFCWAFWVFGPNLILEPVFGMDDSSSTFWAFVIALIMFGLWTLLSWVVGVGILGLMLGRREQPGTPDTPAQEQDPNQLEFPGRLAQMAEEERRRRAGLDRDLTPEEEEARRRAEQYRRERMGEGRNGPGEPPIDNDFDAARRYLQELRRELETGAGGTTTRRTVQTVQVIHCTLIIADENGQLREGEHARLTDRGIRPFIALFLSPPQNLLGKKITIRFTFRPLTTRGLRGQEWSHETDFVLVNGRYDIWPHNQEMRIANNRNVEGEWELAVEMVAFNGLSHRFHTMCFTIRDRIDIVSKMGSDGQITQRALDEIAQEIQGGQETVSLDDILESI